MKLPSWLTKKRESEEEEEEQEPDECAICHRPAILTKKVSGVKAWEPPAAMLINQVSLEGMPTTSSDEETELEEPVLIYLCVDCLNSVAGYIVFLLQEQEKERREKLVNDRLSDLKVGTVLTMIEDSPEPLPNHQVRHMLSHTPFSSIFDQYNKDKEGEG